MPSRVQYCAYESGRDMAETFRAGADDAMCFFCDSDDNQSFMFCEGGSSYWNCCPVKSLDNKLRGRSSELPPVQVMAMGTYGRYYVSFADGTAQWYLGHADEELTSKLKKQTVRSIAFGAEVDSYVIIFDNSRTWRNVPSHLNKYLEKDESDPHCVALHPTNRSDYVVVGKKNNTWEAVACTAIVKELHKLESQEYIKSVFLGVNGTYAMHVVERKSPAVVEKQNDEIKEDFTKYKELDEPTPKMEVVDYGNERFYTGTLARGIGRHGEGVTSYEPTFKWKWFSGKHENDVPSRGILETREGCLYFGDLDHEGFANWGSLQKSNGDFYSGQFLKGLPHGVGMTAFSDGRLTIGWYQSGKRHGPALTFYAPDDHREWNSFTGDYESDDFPKSQSCIEYRDGRVFTGNCKTMKGSTSSTQRAASRRSRGLQPTQEEMMFLERVCTESKELVLSSWSIEQGRVSIDFHAHWRGTASVQKNPSLQRFLRGIRCLSDLFGGAFVHNEHHGVFGWHGTSKKAHESIIEKGFCPSKRDRQNHGPGEYTATSWREAAYFTQDGHTQVILSYSLGGPQLTCHSSFCSVTCNPPATSNVSFMFPMATVTFRPHVVEKIPRPKKSRVWQFFWSGNHEDQWHPYHPHISDQLAALSDEGVETTVLVNHPRHNDQDTDQYAVRITNSIGTQLQINVRTGYTRKVKEVRRIPALPVMYQSPPKPTKRLRPDQFESVEKKKTRSVQVEAKTEESDHR